MHPPRDSPQSYPQNSFLGQGRGVVEYSTREGIRVGGGSWAVPKLSLSPHGAPGRRAPWDSNLPPLLCNRLSLVPLTSTSPTAESLGTWVCGGGEGNPISLPSIWPGGQRAGGPSGPARVGEGLAVAVPTGRGRGGALETARACGSSCITLFHRPSLSVSPPTKPQSRKLARPR